MNAIQHLFIINPIASRVKGKVRELKDEIKSFFRNLDMDNYRIHVTDWALDGMGYVNDFAWTSPVPVRVHVMGGAGTLFEIVNGVYGLPNVQIAAYPMGDSNHVVRYFGAGREHLFRSLENQVFSNTTPIDAMRYDDNYGIGFAVIGLEAVADRDGTIALEKRPFLPADLTYVYMAAKAILRVSAISQNYSVEIDGADHSGTYTSILVAGGPCYGMKLAPAKEAHPNDGVMDVYLLRKQSPLKLLSIMSAYTNGDHERLTDDLVYVRGKKISIRGEKNVVMSLDGEIFYEREISCVVVPRAFDFVCPDSIDVKKLPRIYKPHGEEKSLEEREEISRKEKEEKSREEKTHEKKRAKKKGIAHE